MGLEILSLFATYVSWYVLTKKKNVSLAATILLLMISTLTLLFFFDQQHRDYAFAQAVFLPVFCIYLKGFRLGTLYSSVYIFIVLAIAFPGIDTWEAVPFTVTSFTNLTFTYIVVILAIYYYELSRTEAFKIIEEAHKELQDYKDNLEKKVEIALEEKRQQEAILIQQSKMATMGEMIASIAHQWKQPLATTSSIIHSARIKDTLDHKHDPAIDQVYDNIMSQIEYMDKTVSDFSNFFKPRTEHEFFSLSLAIEDVIKILQPQLKKHTIDFENMLEDDSIMIEGHRNEFSQVLLNIISNAKDAIVENIKQNKLSKGEGKIRLEVSIDHHDIEICVCDNGGGIPSEVMHNIFDPYFTTKTDEIGTGIGLYMSKMIMESHMQGQITAENKDEGACIYVNLKGIKKYH